MSSKSFPKLPEIQFLEKIGQGGYGYVYSALEVDPKDWVIWSNFRVNNEKLQ